MCRMMQVMMAILSVPLSGIILTWQLLAGSSLNQSDFIPLCVLSDNRNLNKLTVKKQSLSVSITCSAYCWKRLTKYANLFGTVSLVCTVMEVLCNVVELLKGPFIV